MVESGDLRVDLARRQVCIADQEVHLTPIEYKLLTTLVRYAGKVVTQRQLLREVWGYAEDVMSRTVDTHVAMLRRKLEHDPAHPRHIVTVRTFGYRIER